MAKPVRPARRVAAGAFLALPVAALLCVPWYARSTPRLAGVEFFYWYQFAWVPGSVICMLVAYLLLHGRRRRPPHR
ncbi:DUF3311 domain-containing protein [Actinomadura sp. 6K520]|jgi:hypothetical protein|uniref:DUF3311 domain-containing protein n=1 Tax=Actinomadura sp. 6K520 TaxID=2530364 RepID=UPI001052BE85|nr:DUF3311 domain-containing protein [Actinomadura sp. 6K520]TDE33287.1 DUF3311 domain-containing protein [Actinomadura sp. 6K520]